MKDGFRKTLVSGSPEHTQKIAALLAPGLVPGDTVLLSGDIGTGKSHFARSLIQARLAAVGISEDIPSPTYTLVQTYSDDITDIWHADLYRLTQSHEIFELGLQDAFQTAICLVEWPDRLGSLRPDKALTIQFELGATENSRRLTFKAGNEWAAKVLPVISNKDHI